MINDAAVYLHGVPHEIGDVIDRTMCAYTRYFPNLPCILHTCDNRREDKYKERRGFKHRQIVRYKKVIHDQVMDHKNRKKRRESHKFP